MSDKQYKALLFDNDGTVVDTKDCILTSVAYTMQKCFGIDNFDKESFVPLIGLPIEEQFAHFTDDAQKIFEMAETYRAHNSNIVFTDSKNFPGLPEALKKLKDKGYFLGIVTSKRHATCKKGLDVLDILQFFEYIQGSDDTKEHKPDPGCLQHAFKRLELAPKEVVYIGDSIYDMQAGNNAGCDICAVAWGCATLETLSKENPTYVANSPEDLLKLF